MKVVRIAEVGTTMLYIGLKLCGYKFSERYTNFGIPYTVKLLSQSQKITRP
jgi:hypothetical protein